MKSHSEAFLKVTLWDNACGKKASSAVENENGVCEVQSEPLASECSWLGIIFFLKYLRSPIQFTSHPSVQKDAPGNHALRSKIRGLGLGFTLRKPWS